MITTSKDISLLRDDQKPEGFKHILWDTKELMVLGFILIIELTPLAKATCDAIIWLEMCK